MQHITTLTLVLSSPGLAGLSPMQAASAGPYLQGVLMEHVDRAYVDMLHQLPFNPYSQYCRKEKESGNLVWRINALTDEAAAYIVEPLLKKDSFAVRGLKSECAVLEKRTKAIALKSLTDMVQEKGGEKAVVRFVTPASFKSKGRYVFMPSVHLLIQSLLMHYSQVYEGDKEVDEETISYMEQHAVITSYNLRSQYFMHVVGDNRKIPAFVGSASFSFKGPQTASGLAKMLLKFGEYAGVGIKTSMGMGGMECELRSKENSSSGK